MDSACTLCLKSLNLGEIEQLPCHETHKLHKRCYRSWTNSLLRNDPNTQSMSCPLCRHSFSLKPPQQKDILEWQKKAIKAAAVALPILGIVVGLGITHCSYAERVYTISSRALKNSSKIIVPLVFARVSYLGSSLLSNPESAPVRWMQKAVVLAYNKIHGTKITSRDLLSYRATIAFTPEQQVRCTLNLFTTLHLWTFLDVITDTPFSVEDRALCKKVTTDIERIINDETEQDNLVENILQNLLNSHPDTHEQLSGVGITLIGSTLSSEDTELKTQLNYFVKGSILDHLLNSESVLLAPNSNIGVLILALRSVEMMKTWFSQTQTQESLQVWTRLLKELQNECNDSTSKLLSRLLKSEYGTSLNFKKLPLIQLLCDDNLSVTFFKHLYAMKKEEDPTKYTSEISVYDTPI